MSTRNLNQNNLFLSKLVYICFERNGTQNIIANASPQCTDSKGITLFCGMRTKHIQKSELKYNYLQEFLKKESIETGSRTRSPLHLR